VFDHGEKDGNLVEGQSIHEITEFLDEDQQNIPCFFEQDGPHLSLQPGRTTCPLRLKDTTMFTIPQASTLRAAALAAAVALFASHTAMASQPKEISYWADAQTAARAGQHDAGANAQLAARAGQNDRGASEQLASRAGQNDRGASEQLASRAGQNDRGASEQLA
jgi:hypothetical protein